MRLGARLSHILSMSWNVYAGLAYDQEFAGKAKATTNTVAARYSIDAPDASGGTGVGEIGFTGEKGGFKVDLGVQGYSGQVNGVTGSMRLRFLF